MEQVERKVKKLGGKKFGASNSAKKLSNNVVGSTSEDDRKWLDGVQDQLIQGSAENLEEGLDVRAVPLGLINIDPSNPRELDIEPEEILKNIDKLKLPIDAYGNDDEWISSYEETVKSLFGDTKKAKDCKNLALFAASIKSPENLMSPICTWREETTFFLFAGERRYLAHFFMGATHCLTRIWHKKPNSLEMKLLEWQENHEREDLTVVEALTNIRQILKEWHLEHPEEKMNVRKFARIIGMGKSQAGVWYKVAVSENRSLNEALKAGKIKSIETAYELAVLSDKEIDLYIKRIADGESIRRELIEGEKKNEALDGVNKSDGKTTSLNKRQKSLKLNSKADTRPVAFIVRTVAKKLNLPALDDELKDLNLGEPKELAKALERMIEFIESEGVAEQ